jgi:hypothetical protein
MPARFAVGVGLAALVAALAVALTRPVHRIAADNGKLIRRGVVVPGGKTFCQAFDDVPSDAASLRVWVSTAGLPGGPLDATIVGNRGVAARGHAPGGYRDQAVSIPLSPLRRDVAPATVCVRNGGARQGAFMGEYAPGGLRLNRKGRVSATATASPNGAAYVPGVNVEQIVVRLEFRRTKPESWLSFAPRIAQRAMLGRASFVGTWTFWAVAVAVVLTALGAIALAMRERGA